MKFMSFALDGKQGLAVETGDGFRGLMADADGYPGDLGTLIAEGDAAVKRAGDALAKGQRIDPDAVAFLPPIANPPKVICIGLNYLDHSAESGFTQPDYPTIFGRFNSSLIGHGAPIVRPQVSVQLDYEGELVAVIGKGGRNIAKADALDHVAGYSIFNDGSIRDYQLRRRNGRWARTSTPPAPSGPGSSPPTRCRRAPGPAARDAAERPDGAEREHDDMIFSVAQLRLDLSARR